MRSMLLLATLAAALPAAAAAQSTVVLGTNAARACYEAALASSRGSASGVIRCEEALDGPISVRDRAATEVNMGIVLMNAGRTAEAFAAYDRAIAAQPGLAEAWLNRGIGWLGQRDYAAAEADLTRALELDVRDAHKAYYHRALAHDARENYTQAYYDFQQALSLSPGWHLPLRELERYEVVRADNT